MLTVVEEGRLRVAGCGAGRSGGGRGAAAAPLADHVDLLVRLIGQLRSRGRLPLLGHEATRHGARIGLSAAASRDRTNREKERKEKERRPGRAAFAISRDLLRCDGPAAGAVLICDAGGARAARFDRPCKLCPPANLERHLPEPERPYVQPVGRCGTLTHATCVRVHGARVCVRTLLRAAPGRGAGAGRAPR